MLMDTIYMIIALFVTYFVVKEIIAFRDSQKQSAIIIAETKKLEKQLSDNIETMKTLMDDIIREYEKTFANKQIITKEIE